MEVTSRARSVPSRYHAKKKTPATFAHRNGDPNTDPFQEPQDLRSRSRSSTPRGKEGRGKGILEKCPLGATRFEGRRRNRTISCDDPNLLTSCPNSSSTAMPLLLILLLISPQLQFPPLFLSGRASVGWTFRNVESVNREEGREKVSIHVPQPPPQIRNPLLF